MQKNRKCVSVSTANSSSIVSNESSGENPTHCFLCADWLTHSADGFKGSRADGQCQRYSMKLSTIIVHACSLVMCELFSTLFHQGFSDLICEQTLEKNGIAHI